MFIGVSGNAPFLETYWRHIFLTCPLALAGGNSLRIPHSASLSCGCYVVRLREGRGGFSPYFVLIECRYRTLRDDHCRGNFSCRNFVALQQSNDSHIPDQCTLWPCAKFYHRVHNLARVTCAAPQTLADEPGYVL